MHYLFGTLQVEKFTLPVEELQKRYPQIAGFHYVSSFTGDVSSLNDLRETYTWFIGLSIERPILDHHPKAHIHEIRRILPVKSGGFHEIREIRRISPVKSGGFHPDITCEIHPKL